MSEAFTWRFAIGDVSLTLRGPAAWLEPFAQGWQSLATDAPGWTVEFVADDTLPAPTGPYFGARPRFMAGRCRLATTGFVGEIDPDSGVGQLRAHPAIEPGDISYFIRTAFALRAFAQGRLLFHAAGIVHREMAFVFFGRSGSGKTTASQLSTGRPVLNDDLLLLAPALGGWDVWATPFGRRRCPEVQRAPLRALLRLVQASEDRLEPMPGGEALAELLANSPVVNADLQRAPQVLAYWGHILAGTPVYRLHFLKANTFWEVINAEFE